MAGSIPDYKRTKANADKAIAKNLKLYKDWGKFCNKGSVLAGDVHDSLTLKSSGIETYAKEIDKIDKGWIPVTEALADLQAEMKEARKKKKTAEVEELKQKIKLAQKEYEKHAKVMRHLFDRMVERYHESKALAEGVLKI